MDPTTILAVALGALGAALFLLSRRHAERVARLEHDIETVETRNRQIENENRRLQEEGAATLLEIRKRDETITRVTAERDAYDRTRQDLEARVAAVQTEKLALESARTRLAESCNGLEQKLATLSADKDDLERRTVGFQGDWDRQMTTIEEEIQTLVRQLGEFRKGTRLPVPPRG